MGAGSNLIFDQRAALGVFRRIRCIFRVPADDRMCVSQGRLIETGEVEGWEGGGEEGKDGDGGDDGAGIQAEHCVSIP